MHLFSTGDYQAFVLGLIWIGITAVCVWWPLADYGPPGFKWNDWQLQIFGVDVDFSLYLPWTACVCLVLWLGLEWAAVPAYLATLFSTLNKHSMPLDVAVVNALHNPMALAVFFLFYCNYSRDYTLRSARSIGWFVLACLCASLMGSTGALISQFTGNPLGLRGVPVSFLSAWLGWWPNALGLALFTSGPLIYLFSARIERLKQRHFARAYAHPFSPQELLLAVSMFALTLVLFVLADNQWTAGRMNALLQAEMSAAARKGIQTELSTQQFVIWLFALLLVGISLGGVYFATRWVRRLRTRYDTETREARDALRRSEANFRNFFENNPAPMFIYDRVTGAYVDVNKAAVERYGYSREEFQSITIYDVRPKEDVARLKQFMRDMAGRDPEFRHAGEWRHLTKSGEIIDVDVRVSPLVMDNRELSLVLIHDISPRKQAQVAVERRARELQMLAASSLKIAGAGSMEEVLQIAADRARELSGSKLAVTHSWPREDGAPMLLRASLAQEYAGWREFKALPDGAGIYRMLTEKQYPIRLTAVELEKHPDFLGFGAHRGQHPPLKGLLAVPLTGGAAEVVGALMVSDKQEGEYDAEDEALLVQLAQITSAGLESVRLNEALRRHSDELEQRVAERTSELDASNKELDAFAYSVAHDLRAPLRAMHGFADAVLEDYGVKLDATGRDYLQRVVNSARNMDILIQDLLAYSRAGRENAALEGVSLEDTVREALVDLQQEIETRRAHVRVEVPPLTVLAHKATLKQVVFNLVANALKFVAPGKAPEVRISAVAQGGGIELSVEDNGIGIAPEHRERIFNVFERLHGAETYAGTGIGLSIVKKGLVRMHGDISVESGGVGSTFRVRLKEFVDE